MKSDRPIVGVVAQDPALEGPCGLTVRRWDAVPECVSIPVRSVAVFRWLGDAVARACRVGERLAFVTERDAFGPSVARKLGIAVGIVEGLLVDLNAVEAESRIDVVSAHWRTVLGKPTKDTIEAMPAPRRRAAWKAAAVAWAQREFGLELTHDAAESLAISEWYRRKYHGKRGKK